MYSVELTETGAAASNFGISPVIHKDNRVIVHIRVWDNYPREMAGAVGITWDELAVIDDRNLKLPCVEYTRDMKRLNAVTFL
jgi:hypothetical protein